MKKHIPNLITCLNLTTGAIGCMEILIGDYRTAIYYVLIAAVFDFFDGFAARMLHVKSEIGKELDSLADMVSFGLLPAFFMLKFMENSHPYDDKLVYSGLLIAVFSALRLAKFNVDTRQSDVFIGLPTPANTLLITSLIFLPIEFTLWVLLSITGISCFLLVSPFRLLALKFQSFGWKGNELRYGLMLISIALLLLLGLGGIPLLIPAYLLASVVGNFLSSKTV